MVAFAAGACTGDSGYVRAYLPHSGNSVGALCAVADICRLFEHWDMAAERLNTIRAAAQSIIEAAQKSQAGSLTFLWDCRKAEMRGLGSMKRTSEGTWASCSIFHAGC